MLNLYCKRMIGKKLRQKTELSHLVSYWPKAVDWYESYFSKFTLKMYKTASEFLDLPNCHNIIEIGGGLGLGAQVILSKLPPTARYTLTNHVNCLVELTKLKNLPQTEVIKVDPSWLPFTGESFDRYIAMATLEELDNARQVVQEAYRVLEPGGIMVASVTRKMDVHSLWMIFNKIRDKHGISHPLMLKQNLGNVGAVRTIFKEAGFSYIFAFYESARFNSMDANIAKNVFLEEPIIKEARTNDKTGAIEKSIKKELEELFLTEEIPLSAEFLVIVAHKSRNKDFRNNYSHK